MTTFVRLLDSAVEDKASLLLRAVQNGHALPEAPAGISFERDPQSFSRIPGSPFAYWVSSAFNEVFSRCEAFEGSGRIVLGGLKTLSDERFVRLSWEPSDSEEGWIPLAKGGAFATYYADVHLLVNWKTQGADISWYGYQRRPREGFGAATRGAHAYFRPGLTWSRRSQTGLSLRALPAGCIFGDKGPAAFVDSEQPDTLLALLTVATSVPFQSLVALQMAFGSYEVGVIQRTPVPPLAQSIVEALAPLARRAWSLKRLLDTTNETSHAFVLPPGTLGYETSPLHPKAGGFNRAEIHRELAEIQAEIDDKVFSLYGISDEDRATIEASMSGGASNSAAIESAEDESSDEDDDSEEDSESTVELTATTLTTYSWLVGVAFGRFDPRLATSLVKAYRVVEGRADTLIEGQRPIPPEPEPFDPLPSRSPGMWPEDEVPVTVPPDIMVDDPGHDHDIRMLVASAAAMTGWPDPEDLRQWLAKDFFPLHIKMYSKSRRKAPIYWQLATPSASYSVWLYIHAFTKDTLFRVQNDYVAPKLAHEQRKLESLQAASQDGQTASERKELAAQESLVEELRAFLDEVKRVAPLWNPNLDDGVIINFSLLWRLVPQHKPWQKELKSTWDALCAGKYDWAHLAMHLWPERVVPQCTKDRSLAIAHGLEEAFWIEGSDGKWTARKTPTTPVSELIQERTSPAVQDALKRLLSAPAPAAGGAKKKAPRKKTARKSKAAKAKGDSV